MIQKRIEHVKKIAILKGGALGDFIVTLPAIRALRSTYPNAEIVLLGLPWHKKFIIKNRTPIDRVIIVPVIKGIREENNEEENEEETETFFEALKEENFDIAIGFQGKRYCCKFIYKKTKCRS